MRGSVFRSKDIWSGLMFIGFGTAFLWIGWNYSMGAAHRIGPGYFPMMLSLILIALGIAIVVRGWLRSRVAIEDVALRACLIVTLAVVVFGFIVRDVGLIMAVVALVVIGGAASTRSRWHASMLLAVALAIFCSFVFVKELGLPFSYFGRLFGT